MGRHRILVTLVTLAALVAAGAYVSQRSASYEAKAEILVTPLPSDDQTYQGLPFLRDFGEASRTIQTAAALIDSPAAADLTAERLGDGWDRTRIDNTVEITPLGESTVLNVLAKADDAELAAEVANTFAQSTLDVRRGVVKRQVSDALERLRIQQEGLTGINAREASVELASQIAALERVENGDDPTLSFSERAAVPDAALGTPAWLVIALALVAGLALGAGAALLLELGDRAVHDEFDVLATMPVPVFARSPVIKGRRRTVTKMPPGVAEAFRTVRIRLERSGGGRRAILVTSATSGDGKTTSAINLALSLIGAGHRVLLMDFDLRKPDVATKLGITLDRGLAPTLTGTPLADLVTSAPDQPLLRVIPAATTEGDVVLLESLRRRMPSILAEARELADYVVIDSAPLGEVADALTIASEVDDILFVARTGHTNRRNLEIAADLLDSIGRQATGIILVGDSGGLSNSYYQYGGEARSGRRTSSRGA